jgi:two-component system NtrC family sensor kinase
MRLTKKITSAFLLLSLLTLITTSIVLYLVTRQNLTKQFVNHLLSVSEIQAHRVEQNIHNNFDLVALVTCRTYIKALVERHLKGEANALPEINNALEDIRDSVPGFNEVFVLSPEGKVIASSSPERIGTVENDKEYFRRGLKEISTDVSILSSHRYLKQFLAGPLVYENAVIGVLVIKSEAKSLLASIRDYTGLGDTGETLLVELTEQKRLRFLTPFRFKTSAKNSFSVKFLNNLEEDFIRDPHQIKKVYKSLKDYRNISVIASVRSINKTPFFVISKIDRKEAFEPITQLRNWLILILFILSVSVVLFSMYIAQNITNPILELTQAATKISNGDLSHQINIDSTDEIGILAQSFKGMTQNLIDANTSLEQKVQERTAELSFSKEEIKNLNRELEHKVIERTQQLQQTNKNLENLIQEYQKTEIALKQSEERLRTVISRTPIILFSFDQYGIITLCEGKGMESLGFKAGELVGRSAFDIYRDIPAVHENLRQVLSGQVTSNVIDLYGIFLEFWMSPIYDSSHGIMGASGVALDITNLKKAENQLRQSEERFRRLVETARTIPWEAEAHHGKFTYIGPQVAELLGYSIEEWKNANFWENHLHPEDRDSAVEFRQKAIQSQSLFESEYRLKHQNGNYIWIHDILNATDEKADQRSLQGFMVDITEKRKTEESARTRTNRIIGHQKALLELSKLDHEDLDHVLREIIKYTAVALNIERVSVWFFDPAHTEISCKHLFQLRSNTYSSGFLIHSSDYPKYFQALEENLLIVANNARQDPFTREFASGYLVPNDISSMMDVPIRPHGKVVGILCHEHVGPPREWLVEEQDFATAVSDQISIAIEASERRKAEKELRKAKQELEHRVEERTHELEEANRQLLTEITERRQIEEEIRNTQNFLDSILENIPDMIFVKDAKELRFMKFNKAGEDLLGYSRADLMGKNDYDFFPKEQADFFTQKDRLVLKNGKLQDIPEEPIKTRQKGLRILHTKKVPVMDRHGNVNFLLGISEDITERKRAEKQMIHTEKLVAIGQLVAGIAHEINNPISFVGNNLNNLKKYIHNLEEYYKSIALFLKEQAPLDFQGKASRFLSEESTRWRLEHIFTDAYPLIDETSNGVDRVKKLVTNLKSFARLDTEASAHEDLNRIIEDAVSIASNEIKKKASFEKNLTPLPLIKCNPQQIGQVILNLLMNAVQAIPKQGKIHIESYTQTGWVYFKISDSGTGISPDKHL